MKRILPLLLICSIFIISGYSSCEVSDDIMISFAIKSISREIGCEVSNIDPAVDFALRNVHILSTTGQLTPELLDKIITELANKIRPTTLDSLIELIILLGGEINEGTITSIIDVPDKFLKDISSGYVRGYDLCKVEQYKLKETMKKNEL
jgi:hypothetical protein